MEENNKAVREALIMCADSARCIIKYAGTNSRIASESQVIVDAASHALAAPPRNCDVGTAEEQSRRLAEFCKSHGLVGGVPRCEKCRFLGDDNCELMWAQMPYESEVAR